MEVPAKNLGIFEGKRAYNYDNFVKQLIPNYPYFMSMLPRLLEGTTDKNMLSVGCGTGTEIQHLKDADDTWSFMAVDPSPEKIQLARKKLEKYGDIQFFEGYVDGLPLQPLYGAATLVLVLHFIKYPNERLALLTEIQKRLKPGATFVLMGFFGSRQDIRNNLEILRLLLPTDVPETEIEERMERIKRDLHLTTEEELNKLLVRAGFEPPTRFFQTSIYSAWITKKPTT